MNKKTFGYAMVVILVISPFVYSQKQDWQKLELPKLTMEYKLNRSIINIVGPMMGGIAYAKSKGEKPEDFAPYCTHLIAGSYWKDKDFSYYVRKWYRVFATDENFRMEIIEETKDKIDLKMNIFGEIYIDTYAESGVTREEYIRFLVAMLSSMAEYMGFEYEINIEADWIYISLAKK
jgi:hypothetical protein